MNVFSKQLSGLGNQLFQYAAGLYFADRYKGKLLVIQEPVEGTLSHGGYNRPFLLSRFQITSPIRLKNRLDHLMLSQGPRGLKLSAPMKTLGRIAVRHETKERRSHFIEDLELPSDVRTLYISGFWQAYPYAEAVAPQLRQEFRLREPATGNNQRLLEQIDAAPVSVSLHVRRRDYTLAAEGNIALPLDYYHRAIDLIRRRFEDPVFFIFSDDMEFARKNLPADMRQVFVEGNDDFSSQEDLRLMAACQHHIIANSSFSWWGAWLNPSPKKVVVAPRHWLLSPESAYADLLPPAWHALDSLRKG
ncbi:alpha-1,2-fucosyltransferase [Granulicella sp. S190]|uniref:alpha-1,2-fucosyltransferase n=1 Tax=Granulicella sp. S190 TaxID=1747226 RepID=UPI00131D7C1B|nr:alpha-1,2-fucosyltransferase [Granulicella sp. S190]